MHSIYYFKIANQLKYYQPFSFPFFLSVHAESRQTSVAPLTILKETNWNLFIVPPPPPPSAPTLRYRACNNNNNNNIRLATIINYFSHMTNI